MSSMPRRPRRLEPMPSVLSVFSEPALVLTLRTLASITPNSVTDDWAEATPANAVSAARASRDFFIANISLV